jgi:hypothetical protein
VQGAGAVAPCKALALAAKSLGLMRGRCPRFGHLLAQLRSVARVQDKAMVDSNAKGLYLALAAAHACLRFCGDELQLLMLPDSLPLHHELPARHVHLDAATVANLELESLVCMMDHTVTKGGGAKLCTRCRRCCAPLTLRLTTHVVPALFPTAAARLLKATLLQPVRDLPTLNARLDALDELLRDETLFVSLSQILNKLPKVRACRVAVNAMCLCAMAPNCIFAGGCGMPGLQPHHQSGTLTNRMNARRSTRSWLVSGRATARAPHSGFAVCCR